MSVAATTSELIAIDAGIWKTKINIGVMSEAPPTPVKPTIMPTKKLRKDSNK
jgi:hypothetical protein